MASSSFDVDDVITKLLEVRGSRPGKQVNLTETEIRGLCTGAREIFMSQPVLLELEAPIKISAASIRVAQRARQQRRVVERAKVVHDEREKDTEEERNFGGAEELAVRRGEGGAELLALCAQVRGEEDHRRRTAAL